jgi:hypothetical protein
MLSLIRAIFARRSAHDLARALGALNDRPLVVVDVLSHSAGPRTSAPQAADRAAREMDCVDSDELHRS